MEEELDTEITISEDDVVFEYVRNNGDERREFNKEYALAYLLGKDMVGINTHWYKKEWPEEAKNMFAVFVNCGDTFAYACADAEEVEYKELEDVYMHYITDKRFGLTVWCCLKRNLMPIKVIADAIRKQGIWDIDSFGLRDNDQ